jgi:YD repeat-containing protein
MTKTIIIIAMLLSTAAYAEPQTRFYDARGNSVGTATRDGQGTTTFRDSRGNVVGRSSTQGKH